MEKMCSVCGSDRVFGQRVQVCDRCGNWDVLLDDWNKMKEDKDESMSEMQQ